MSMSRRTALTAALAAGFVAAMPEVALATGGYPHAHYYGPGSNPSTYTWTDSSGNEWSSRGYAYRNCTDFVAWKLQSLGVPDSKTRGLGNGGQWGGRAMGRSGVTVNTTPRYGAAAVNTSAAPPYGHVSFVQTVHGNGTITLTEYNYGSPGNYGTRTGTPTALGVTQFVHFGISGGGGGGGDWPGVRDATFKGGNALTSGQRLNSNEYILSGDGRFVLMMQADGNMVYRGPGGRVLWASNTNGRPGAYLLVQADGNMVIYRNGQVLWASNTSSVKRLVTQNDGNLVAYNAASGGSSVWATSTILGSALTHKGTDTLSRGTRLSSGQFLRSANKTHFLVMQNDGNLVIYGPGYMPYWATGTNGRPGAYLDVQNDGNIVIYQGGASRWATGTTTTRRLVMQNDGNLVAYNAASGGSSVWASNTAR